MVVRLHRLLAVLALVSAAWGGKVSPQEAKRSLMQAYPEHDWSLPVEKVEHPKLDIDVNDFSELYKDNLKVDLMVWRDRVACGGKLEMGPFLEWAKYVTTTTGTKKIVIIKDGKIGFPVEGQETIWNETCPGPCHGLLLAHMKVLRKWVEASPKEWPNVVFLMNAADGSICKRSEPPSAWTREYRKGGCPAPPMSVIKTLGEDKHEDVLVPLLAGMQLQGWGLHSYPWEKKIDKAIFRGSGFCHAKRFSYTNGACSRTYLAARVANNPEWREHIDAGLLNPGRFKSLQFNGSFPVSVEDSAHFRFTLNLDGITASSRLSKLLALNSVVLKQASPHVEWYYRSLLPNVHYLPFWDHGRDDILCVLEQRKRHPDKILKKIAQNGQAFAYHYLRPAARRQYFIEALKEYRELFGSDMDDYITQHAVNA